VLSGPAGGMSGGRRCADLIGIPDLVPFDMGGTSTDISLIAAGQASLSHLRRLPVDMLKLDQVLVNTPAEPAVGPAVIDVVVSLGRRLGLETVAKGLETQEQIERARRAGCLYGQGFALARPAPAERMEAYLDTHRG